MLSKDSQALLLLCSHLGLDMDAGPKPLTLREWNPLARKIQSSAFNRPGTLLGQTVGEIQQQLALSQVEAQRLSLLLERRAAIDSELERLASKGIGVTTRAASDYPSRYRERLKDSAPPILFYAGELALLGQPGIAVVGSRHLDQAGQECAEFVGNTCGLSGLVLYSGGAKGVDTLSMNAALEARGSAVGILADNLEHAVRNSEIRAALARRDLCLATPYAPDAGFSVGAAMGRNRLIYCLADYAIVVASDAEKGGTWAGATEALKAGWLPVFVLDHPAMPEGNRLLLQKGGVAFPHPFPEHYSQLPGWLLENSLPPKQPATQLGLF
ncbi:MAG TPA: DNA-processing protein DprA [Anaerolineaceae bacterium]|nr:DNA-processing protein DprA [Anaerolineaceae bacterium]